MHKKIRGNLVIPMIFAVTERERETILDYLQWKQELRNLQKYKYYDIIFIESEKDTVQQVFFSG